MLKIDLHVHTRYSDSRSTVKEVITEAVNRGLDGIAITDHHTMQGVWDATMYHSELLIIPGIEVASRDGHLIGLGVNDDRFARQSIRNHSAIHVAQMVRALGGLVMIPHPCTPFFSMKRYVIEQIQPDMIEVLNAHSPFWIRDTQCSYRLAKELGVTQIAGSDSHTWQTVGDAYTLVDAVPEVKAVLEAIQAGHTQIAGSASPWRFRFPLIQLLRLLQASMTSRRNSPLISSSVHAHAY